MKSLSWKLCLMAGFCCWVLFGNTTPVLAADDNPGGPDERLQRLERRINDLADRQEQMMRRFGAAPQRQGPMPGSGSEGIRPSMPAPEANPPMVGTLPPPGANPPIVVSIHRLGDLVRLIALGFIVCNILLAIWIYTDIRKRGEGPAIFIALAVVAGIPAAIIYSLVRIGDKAFVAGK